MADARRTEVHRYLRGLFNVGTVAGLSDGDLLDRFAARRGEAAELAFAALVERHGPMVLRVCRKVLRNSDDAADAFQATFLVLARKAGSIRRTEALGAYLHGVALRVAHCDRSAVARRRKHERTYAEKEETSYPAQPPDDLGRVVHEELGRLPERFRGVAVLCDLEGKTYLEAAGLLGCPPGTVMSRLAEARRRLRGRLARRGLAPSAGSFTAALATESAATAKGLPAALAEATIQAATRFAAGPATITPGAVVSASVTALTEGVLRAMFLTQLKSLALVGLVGGVVATGAGVLAQAPEPPPLPPEPPALVSQRATDPQGRPDSANQPASVPQDHPDLAAPADDRLQSLEKKLDRLLQVLESGAAKTSPPEARSPQADRMPSSVTPRPPSLPRPMAPPGSMGGMSGFGMGMGGMAAGMRPGVPFDPAMAPGMMGMSNVAGRLERAEQQLNELAERLNRLEATVFGSGSGERATQKKGVDARTPFRARATPAAVRSLPSSPLPVAQDEPSSDLPPEAIRTPRDFKYQVGPPIAPVDLPPVPSDESPRRSSADISR